jgi:hypothetical protein
LFGLLFRPEDGGNISLWNVCWILTDYKAIYRRKYNYWKDLKVRVVIIEKYTTLLYTTDLYLATNFIQ